MPNISRTIRIPPAPAAPILFVFPVQRSSELPAASDSARRALACLLSGSLSKSTSDSFSLIYHLRFVHEVYAVTEAHSDLPVSGRTLRGFSVYEYLSYVHLAQASGF
jgi:hypothetical protein